MTYFFVCIFGSLVVAAISIFVLGKTNLPLPWRWTMPCVIPSALLLVIGFWFLFAVEVPSANEQADIVAGARPDPGPVSFIKAVEFGFLPAICYFLSSMLLFRIFRRKTA